ncbi:hypothetical protein VLK31_13790 [Variovorax sp. H27-G14]
MPLVLGVMGIPKVEVELLKIIVRLSSNLRSLWTVSDSGTCDVLLVDAGQAGDARHMPAAPLVVVPVVARSEAGAVAHAGGPTLSRPIFAEELVDLLNQVTPRLRAARKAAAPALGAAIRSGRGRASLTRWPAQATMRKNPVYLRLAAALSKSAQSAESLSALSRVHVDECSTFMGLLEQEGVLAWSPDAGALDMLAADMLAGGSAQQRTGLLSRIRRRLGLA